MRVDWASLRPLLLGDNQEASLKHRALNSGIWISGGFALQKILQFGSNLILTRLLYPEAFGLMALATVFLVGLAMFSDIGIRPSVVREPNGDDPAFLNTAWTIQIIRGLLLCLGGMLLAYPISLIYGEPILFPLLAVLSTTAAMAGFTSINVPVAERKLDFRSVTLIQLTGQAVSIIVLIALAYHWRSLWSLAIANVIGSALTVIIGFLMLRGHRHRLQIDRKHASSLISFGKWIFLSTAATYLGGEGLRAVQAGHLTAAEFGILSIAYMMAAAPNDLMTRLTGSIGLPVIAETYRTHPDRAASILSAFRKRILLLSIPIFAALVFAAETIVTLLYDPRYHDAGQYLALLSLANAVSTIGAGYMSALLAIGRSRAYFLLMLTTAVVRIAAVIIGFDLGGVSMMIAAIGIANMFILIVTLALARRHKIADLKLDFGAIAALMSLFAAYLLTFQPLS
jgi:O-antigen/teichoic acid export membrane protein